MENDHYQKVEINQFPPLILMPNEYGFTAHCSTATLINHLFKVEKIHCLKKHHQRYSAFKTDHRIFQLLKLVNCC